MAQTCPIRYNKETGKEYLCNKDCAFAEVKEYGKKEFLYCAISHFFEFCHDPRIDADCHVDLELNGYDNVIKVGLYHNDQLEVCGSIGVVESKEEY